MVFAFDLEDELEVSQLVFDLIIGDYSFLRLLFQSIDWLQEDW